MKHGLLLLLMLFSIRAFAQQNLLERKGSFSISEKPLEKLFPLLKEKGLK